MEVNQAAARGRHDNDHPDSSRRDPNKQRGMTGTKRRFYSIKELLMCSKTDFNGCVFRCKPYSVSELELQHLRENRQVDPVLNADLHSLDEPESEKNESNKLK